MIHKLSTTSTSDDDVIGILAKVDPKALEEIPVAASYRHPEGLATVVTKSYLMTGSRCLVVSYFGHGAKEGDRGWAATLFSNVADLKECRECENFCKSVILGSRPL